MANRSSVSALVERSPRASIRGRNVAVGSRVSTRTREAERSELVRWAIPRRHGGVLRGRRARLVLQAARRDPLRQRAAVRDAPPALPAAERRRVPNSGTL